MSDVFNSVFDFDASQMGVFNETKGGIEQFNPKPEGSKPYVATVKLLPNIKDPNNSIVHKSYYWLDDGQGFAYDIPGKDCPVSAHKWSLKNSKDPIKEKLADKINYQQSYRVFVQVVNDVNNPDQVGKILPWKIPVPVFRQIQSWLKPTDAEVAAGKTPKALFNVFDSYNIILTVTNEIVNGSSMRKYQQELSDSKTAVKIGDTFITNTPEGQQAFIDYFNEQQPELNLADAYGFKAADDALKTRVKAHLINNLMAQNTFWPEIPYTPVVQAAPSITDTPVETATVTQPVQPAQAAQPAQPAQASSADIQAILAEVNNS